MNIFNLKINWDTKIISFENVNDLEYNKQYRIITIDRDSSKYWVDKEWDVGAIVTFDSMEVYGPVLVRLYTSGGVPDSWIYLNNMRNYNITLKAI